MGKNKAKTKGEMSFKRKVGWFFGRLLFRLLLVAIVGTLLIGWGVYQHLGSILLGPSPAARDQMAIYLMSDPQLSWLPGSVPG